MHVVEITDPAHPRHVRFGVWPTLQVQVADGVIITSLERILPGWGGDPQGPFDEGFVIWSLKDPENPPRLGLVRAAQPGRAARPLPETSLVYQSEDVLVNARGNIFVIDKNMGIYVLRIAA